MSYCSLEISFKRYLHTSSWSAFSLCPLSENSVQRGGGWEVGRGHGSACLFLRLPRHPPWPPATAGYGDEWSLMWPTQILSSSEVLKADSDHFPYRGTTLTIMLIYSGVLNCLTHEWSPILNNHRSTEWNNLGWKGAQKGIWSNSLLKAGLVLMLDQVAHHNIKFWS